MTLTALFKVKGPPKSETVSNLVLAEGVHEANVDVVDGQSHGQHQQVLGHRFA